MSRKILFQFILFCFLLITIPLIDCKVKTELKAREDRSTTASESLIVSIVNNVLKLKDNDFLRSGIESSVRSVFSKPLTSAVYAISVLAGVVAMLAFYESPVSPMPVPPLPDPPVGRFPPEHPIWPPPPKEPVHMSDKKRVGFGNAFAPNSAMNSPQLIFPQMNPNQKYSEMDPMASVGAYQQLLHMLENRNLKINTKQNRISSNSAEFSPQVYSSYSIDSDPKLLNDSLRPQTLHSDNNPNDRHDSVDIINKLYNQNNLNNALKKMPLNSDLMKEKEKLNYTLIASSDPNARRLKTKIGET